MSPAELWLQYGLTRLEPRLFGRVSLRHGGARNAGAERDGQ
jgi:hypothetical protein